MNLLSSRQLSVALTVLLVSAMSSMTTAFAPIVPSRMATSGLLIRQAATTEETTAADNSPGQEDGPRRNPDNPALPALKGDFDWDAKFGNDSDWITENVPGKIVLNEIELAGQVTELNKLEERWRKQRLQREYDEARLLGWTEQAEMYNGRYAMFFLMVGLLTEYWTGYSMPQQVEEMLRIAGVIGFDG